MLNCEINSHGKQQHVIFMVRSEIMGTFEVLVFLILYSYDRHKMTLNAKISKFIKIFGKLNIFSNVTLVDVNTQKGFFLNRWKLFQSRLILSQFGKIRNHHFTEQKRAIQVFIQIDKMRKHMLDLPSGGATARTQNNIMSDIL